MSFMGEMLTYLGVKYDSIRFQKSVSLEKLAELLDLLGNWSRKENCTKRGLQSLCGKLFWVAKCVQHSRVFNFRLLEALKKMSEALKNYKISSAYQKIC